MHHRGTALINMAPNDNQSVNTLTALLLKHNPAQYVWTPRGLQRDAGYKPPTYRQQDVCKLPALQVANLKTYQFSTSLILKSKLTRTLCFLLCT
jgi:hypothetical protein